MTKSEKARLLKKVTSIVDRIAAQRDELRSLLSDYEDIAAASEEAQENIEHAIELLSQYL